jgi:hypothetical protein
MTGNRYTGDVPIVLGDKTYMLRADWNAIAAAQEISENPNALRQLYSLNAKQLAGVISALLKKHHPEDPAVTPEAILELSPPIMTIMESLNEAILFAYTGADGVKAVKDAAKNKTTTKKK